MGTPAIVLGDKVMGVCPIHMVPGPTNPIPSPPLPFTAPLVLDCVVTVLISGKPAAVLGSNGLNLPPHVGIVDPFLAPNLQVGRILGGSTSVMIGGKPAAKPTPPPTMCGTPGTIIGTGVTVMIGG